MKKRVFLSLMLCTLTVSFTACGDIRQEDNVRGEQIAETTLSTDVETTAETETSTDVETTAETETSTDTEAPEEMSVAEEMLSPSNRSIQDLFDQSNNKGKTEKEQKKESSKKEEESLKEEESEESESKEDSKQKEDRKETKKDKKSNQEELSDDWTDLQFMMDGAVISVPCSYEELNELGWEFAKYYEDYDSKEIPAGHSDLYQLENEVYGDHIALWASVENTSEERMLATDCPIHKINIETQYKSDELDEAPEILLPGGVALGAQSEDITDAYGKYDSKSKNSKGGRNYTYEDEDLDCEMFLQTSEKYGLYAFTFWQHD